MGNLFLQLALLVSGITVTPNVAACDAPGVLGQYRQSTNTIEMCLHNIAKSKKFTEDVVLRHEVIHAIHHNLGLNSGEQTILPRPLLELASRTFIDEREAFGIVYYYGTTANQEIEARLGQHLPEEVVATGLLYSHLANTISNLR